MEISNNQNCNPTGLMGVVLNEPSIEIVEVNKKNKLEIERNYNKNGKCRRIDLYLNERYIGAKSVHKYNHSIDISLRNDSFLAIKVRDKENYCISETHIIYDALKTWRN